MTTNSNKLFLDLSDWYVSRQIEEFSEYVKAMERLIASDLAREEADLAAAASQLAEEHRSAFYADNADHLQLIEDTFTNRLRLSSITIAHSIIERRIVRVAQELGKEREIKMSDLAGHSPIEKSRKYLECVIGINLTEVPLDRLKNWSKLRNVIAHADGEVSEEEAKKLQPLLSRFPSMIKFIHGHVIVGHGLVNQFLEDIKEINRQLSLATAKWHTSSAP